METKKILLLAGDGIGPEVMAEVKKVILWLNKQMGLKLETEERLVGGAAYDAHKTPLPEATLSAAKEADAIILGAVGGPKWEPLPFEVRPERGLLGLRKELGLFANLRPAMCFEALADASTLKREVISGLDIMIVRELTGGLYFGEPRGVQTLNDGQRRGYNTLTYTTSEIIRIARVALDLARARNKKLCSVDKANVLECTELWREEVQKLRDAEYPDIELSHMYVDNASMQLVRNPRQFDVMVTENMFGDILSDCAAMLTGSLGMLPSASLGARQANGKIPGMYEPVHGSAPDIAGKGIANPIATLLSVAMMLRYSFAYNDAASLLERAVDKALADGVRTGDIAAKGEKTVSTSTMGNAIIERMEALARKGEAA
jgi:3-isopropylmalate dehydrogenase